MPEVLRHPKLCDHEGGIVMTESEVRCADCYTEMVWVSKEFLRSLQRSPTEQERELRRQLNVKNDALERIRQYLREVGTE
jgi:hypothetical protein